MKIEDWTHQVSPGYGYSYDAERGWAKAGVTWANEQKDGEIARLEAEIAVLKGILVRHREEIASLEAELSKYRNRDSE